MHAAKIGSFSRAVYLRGPHAKINFFHVVLLRSRKRKWRTIFVDTTSYGLSAIYGLCIGKSFFTSDISLYLLEVCHGDLWPTRRNGACIVEESSKSTRRRPWAEHEGRRLRDSS